MWRQQGSRGEDRYGRGGGRRDYEKGDGHNYRRNERHMRETDRFDDRHREDQISDNRDGRYFDYDEEQGYGDWDKSQLNYTSQTNTSYYDDGRERQDYPEDSEIPYRIDRVKQEADRYDRDTRYEDFDDAGYSGYMKEERTFVEDDRNLYEDDRFYDDPDQREDQHQAQDNQYHLRDEEARYREDTRLVYDDMDNTREHGSVGYDRDDGRRDFRDAAYNRDSERRSASNADISDDRRQTSRFAKRDRLGHHDRMRERDIGNNRRDRASDIGRSSSDMGRRGNVTTGQHRQNVRQREVSTGSGRMKTTAARNMDTKSEKTGHGNQRVDQRSDSRNTDRQARNSNNRGNQRAGRSAVLKDDRGRYQKSRNSDHRDRSSLNNKSGKSNDDRISGSKLNQSTRTGSRESRHRS